MGDSFPITSSKRRRSRPVSLAVRVSISDLSSFVALHRIVPHGPPPRATARRHWLDRSGADLSAETAPELFATAAEDSEFEVPDELRDVFTVEELTEMEEDDFDDLIDQIDEEQESESKRDDVLSGSEIAELEEMMAD